MVLSHTKLKRKRKDELAAVVGTPYSTPASPEAGGDGKKKKAKGKKQKTSDVAEGNGGNVGLAASNGAVDAEEAPVPKEEIEVKDKKALKRDKKEEKKRRKAAEREAAAQNPPSALKENGENGEHSVENRAEEAAGNGGEKAELPVGENGATSAGSERPLSVREKKGKKKKGAKDRWGVTIVPPEENVDDIPVQPKAVKQEAPSTSAVVSGEEMYDLRKVVVGGMPYYCTEDDIHEYFTECGEISELDCMIFPDTGKFRGIAFITFKTEESAARALEYDGEDMGGRFLKIEKCKIKPGAAAKDPERGEVQKTPGSTSVYIGNLSWDVTEDLIKNFFKKTYSNSKVDSIRLAFDKDSGDFKGYGHIDFGDDDSLEAAVKMNQTPLLGRPMKVAYSVPPKRSAVNGGDGKSESRSAGTCYTCGEDGHKAFLCPKKGVNANDKFDSKKVAACYSCGEEGHKSFLCPKKKST